MRTQNWRWLAALCLPLLMLAGSKHLTTLEARGPQGQADPSVVPLHLGDWQGTEIPVDAAELVDEYVAQQVPLIESQAAIAAVVWAKRNGLEPQEQSAVRRAEMAAAIAEAIRAAAGAQVSADDLVAARLKFASEYAPEDAA